MPLILSGTTRSLQECGQIPEKSRYTVNRVPPTKNRLRAPLNRPQKKKMLSPCVIINV